MQTGKEKTMKLRSGSNRTRNDDASAGLTNSARILQFAVKAIRAVVKDEHAKRNPTAQRKPPFRGFREKYDDQPDLPILIRARGDGNTNEIETLERKISRHGRRGRSANLRVAETRGFLDHIARAYGRKPSNRTSPCDTMVQRLRFLY